MIESIAVWFVLLIVGFALGEALFIAAVRLWRVDLYTIRARLRQSGLTWECNPLPKNVASFADDPCGRCNLPRGTICDEYACLFNGREPIEF